MDAYWREPGDLGAKVLKRHGRYPIAYSGANPNRGMGGDETMSQDGPTQKTRRGRPPRATKGKKEERTKCSLLLSKENDLRLTVLASLRGLDRSGLLNEILDEQLRGVVVSLRGPLAEGVGREGGGLTIDSRPEDEAEQN